MRGSRWWCPEWRVKRETWSSHDCQRHHLIVCSLWFCPFSFVFILSRPLVPSFSLLCIVHYYDLSLSDVWQHNSLSWSACSLPGLVYYSLLTLLSLADTPSDTQTHSRDEWSDRRETNVSRTPSVINVDSIKHLLLLFISFPIKINRLLYLFSCCCSRSPLLFSLWNLYPKKGCESTDDDDDVVNFVKNPCWVTLVLPSSVCPVNAFFISSFECFFVLLWLSCRDRHESTTDWLTDWSWIRVTFWVTLCHDDDVVRTTPVSLYVWCSRWWWWWWDGDGDEDEDTKWLSQFFLYKIMSFR